MRLSWNHIRIRAAAFAGKWADAGYEKGETQSFYNDFFEIFGKQRSSVARYEEHVRRLDNTHGYIDLFWPKVLLVEQKSAGRDLIAAAEQAGSYFDALAERDRPRYQLLCDFRTFELLDRDEREQTRFSLAELPRHVEKFGFMLGVEKRSFRDQDPVNIEVAERMARLHDELRASGYAGPDLELLLVRMVFCLFADNTGIFEPRDILLQLIEDRTAEDGGDLGAWLMRLFQVLNTPVEQRQHTLDEDLARFPYINGALFAAPLPIPEFNAPMRNHLLDACRFDWTAISPAIFGALFQSVMEPEARRAQGAHYTTEKNILKVIQPLFMDDLKAEFAHLKVLKRNRGARLREFHQRLAQLIFFDPACGCGNFLIIAYRELRELEMEVIRALRRDSGMEGQAELDPTQLSLIDVDRFYGIERDQFPARIAEVALWMMDHIMNNRLSLEFGQLYARIPIAAAPHIRNADALETDWEAFLPPSQCAFVFGNPPFVGAKYQSVAQRAQVRRIAALGNSGGTLDYVAAWFIRAGQYLQQSRAHIGFVATNSLTQGEQVAQLWPILLQRLGLVISFAHCSFVWGSDARGVAHVHVVIIGLSLGDQVRSERLLFSYDDLKGNPVMSRLPVLSPYLFDASRISDPGLVVGEEGRPINGLPRLGIGSKPIDGGHYIFTAEQKTAFLAEEPEAEQYLRPYIGAREYVDGSMRWILALHDAPPQTLRTLPKVRDRIAAVRDYRLASKSKLTQSLAATPTLYHINVIPTAPFLMVPRVSTRRREYVPIGWLAPPVIPSDAALIVHEATLWLFALLTSAMHMTWLRYIGGRLGSSYRYSAGLVYNTFPLPPVEPAALVNLTPHTQAILTARADYPDASLADLYDPTLMPPILRKAHQTLDRAVDRLYRPKGFTTDRERVEHLFTRYEHLQTPITATPSKRRRRR